MSGSVVSGRSATDGGEQNSYAGSSRGGSRATGRRRKGGEENGEDGGRVDEPGQYEFGTSTHGSIVNGLASSSSRQGSAKSVTGKSQLGGGRGSIAGSMRSGRSGLSTASSRVTAVKRQIGRVLELSEVDAMGNPIDGYDYNSHFSAISGSGIFVTKGGELMKSSVLSVGSQRSRRSGTMRGNNDLIDNDDIGDSASVGWGPASVADDAIDAVITTHEAARRVNLPLDVLPAVPEFENDDGFDDDNEEGDNDGATAKSGRRPPQLAALSLLPETLPADLKRLLDLVESVDVDGEFELTDEDWALDKDEIVDNNDGGDESKNAAAPQTTFSSSSSSSSETTNAAIKTSTKAARPSKAHVSLRRAAVGVEELDDNFVLQALGAEPIPEIQGNNEEEGEGEEDDDEEGILKNDPSLLAATNNAMKQKKKSSTAAPFDFDAHIAKLMARAEGQWVDTNELYDNNNKQDEDEDEDDDEEYDEDDDVDEEEDNNAENYDSKSRGGRGGAGANAQAPFLADSSGRGRIGESALSAMLANYDDDLIGELDDDPLIHQDGFAPLEPNEDEEEEEEEEEEEDVPKYRGLGFKRKQDKNQKLNKEEDEEGEDDEEGDGDEGDEDEEGEEDEDESAIDFQRPAMMTANAFLLKAMEDFEREKSERHLYQGRRGGDSSGNKKGRKAIGSTWEEEEDDGDKKEKNKSNIINDTNSVLSTSAAGGVDASVITSSSVPVAPSAVTSTTGPVKSGGFTVKIGLLSSKKDKIVPPPSSSFSSSSSILGGDSTVNEEAFVRPPSPVSASAAIAVKVAMGRMHGVLGAMGGVGDLTVAQRVAAASSSTTYSGVIGVDSTSSDKNIASNDGSSSKERDVIPFGWAEGDIADATDADMFPSSWVAAPSTEPKWDVNTIISTYSNTDNHPRRLDDGVSIVTSKRSGLGPRVIGVDKEEKEFEHGKEGANDDASSVGSLLPGLSTLRLSRKTGMPMKQQQINTSTDSGVGRVDHTSSSSSSTTVRKGNDIGTDNDHVIKEEEEEDEEEEDSDNDLSAARFQRRRGETPEERKIRKAAVKAERRERRADKKGLKLAFKDEILRQRSNDLRLDALARGTIL